MLAAWMLYALAVTGLVAAAAIAVEAARSAGPAGSRWGWVAGFLVAPLLVLLPPLAALRGPWGTGGEASASARDLLVLGAADPAVAPVSAPGGTAELLRILGEAGAQLSPWILGLWVSASALLLLRTGFGMLRLRRDAARWPRVEVAGLPVLVSDGVGPGIFGVVRPRTVLPGWCLALDRRDQALVVAHEEEHRRAGDMLLLALARTFVVLAPWNLALWWMHGRLRTAVEVDCDARVARRFPAFRRRYAELLLAAATRPSPHGHPALAAPLALFAEPATPLFRRIDMITRTPTPPPARRRLGGLLLALAFLLVAAGVPACDGGTTAPRPFEAPVQLEGFVSPPSTGFRAPGEPTFTPFTVAPEVQNRAEVIRALEREYPPVLRDAGIGGSAVAWMHVDSNGRLVEARLRESSGFPALDEAALRVAETFLFSPALNLDDPVAVWVQIPITFQARPEERRAEARVGEGARPDPELRGMQVAPEVRNRSEVLRLLETEYPPLLRDAGIGGTVQLRVHVDAEGNVAQVELAEPSGHEALDQAALRVGERFVFAPALSDGQRVPVRIEIPLTFRAAR
jgi:TonB family protein